MMKNFTFLALFILIMTSPFSQDMDTEGDFGGSSGGPKQSWDDIMRNPILKPEFPSFFIQSHYIRYDRLCLIGTQVRTSYRQELGENEDGLPYYDYLYADRVTNYNNGRRRVLIPSKLKIKVYQLIEDSDDMKFLFKKQMKLAPCLYD